MNKYPLLILIGIVFFLLQNTTKAQEYVPFPDSNAIWSEVFTSLQPFEIYTYQYGVLGDTLLNSKWYNKVYLLNDTLYPLTIGQYCGSIREDSLKRVYAINCICVYPGAGNEEVLLYDFSKSIGDTVFVGMDSIGPMGLMVIDHIDSILIDNNYRKTFHFSYDDYWIEGIGSTRGLFSPIVAQPTGFQDWDLICFNQDNMVMYLNPEYNSCFPILTGINDYIPQKNNVKIYPHPVWNISTLDFSKMEADYSILEIFNIHGKKVKHVNLHGENHVKIYNYEYKPGIYIFKLSGDSSEIIKGKMIIMQ
jgi:hypothetical protein